MKSLKIFNINKKNKKGIEIQEVGLWVLALVALALIIAGIILMRGKGINILDQIKELLRFGR